MAEAEKDDWLDDLDSPAEQASELDQSDIDALLSGADEPGAAAAGPGPAEGEAQELGQSDIDALLAGVGEPAGGGIDDGDLDQSDIDALLAGPRSETRDQAAIDPDQDEIDKLFSDIDSSGGGGKVEESPFPSEEIDFKDVFDSNDSATQTGLPNFDAEEFKLDADIPDIPDTTGFDLEDSDIFKDTVVAAPPPPQPTPKSEPAPQKEPPAEAAPPLPGEKKRWRILDNRKALIGLGSGLAVLLIAGGVFLFRGAPKPTPETAPAVVAHQPAPAEHEAKTSPPEAPALPEPPAQVTQAGNGAPTVNDLELTMPPESSQLMITLCGLDPENAPLEYEFQSMPEHGQLSGHAPNLIYTPKPGFSGPDGFTVRATDGKNYSAPALVKINRQPPLEAPATLAAEPLAPTPEPAKEEKAKQEGIAASDRSYTVTSSKGQIISWQKIWSKSNDRPFDPEVRVDILSGPRHGTLSQSQGQQSIYRPEQAFRGTDTIRYRFKQGGLVSPTKTVTFKVQPKNRAPVLALQPVAPAYNTGETVIMNAGRTKDEHRDSLSFHWEQVAGVPVVIRPLNSEGSQVSFVAPASFNTVSNPLLLFKVTVTDRYGAQDSQEVSVTTKSRRHSAVWRGRHE